MPQSKQGRYVGCADCGCRLEKDGVCQICAHEDIPPLPYMVPDVIDITQAAAETLITCAEAQLTVGDVTTDNDPGIAVGNVISSDPVKDTQLTIDDPVDLVVSLGPI